MKMQKNILHKHLIHSANTFVVITVFVKTFDQLFRSRSLNNISEDDDDDLLQKTRANIYYINIIWYILKIIFHFLELAWYCFYWKRDILLYWRKKYFFYLSLKFHTKVSDTYIAIFLYRKLLCKRKISTHFIH